ncbi:hypothetical protein ACWCQZ_47140 [Streptomyces sp. NPDC002285]
MPSYSTVYAIARALDPALVMLAHEGAKRYREVYDLIHRREAEGPNTICHAASFIRGSVRSWKSCVSVIVPPWSIRPGS